MRSMRMLFSMMLDCGPGWGTGSRGPGLGDSHSAASDLAVELGGKLCRPGLGGKWVQKGGP